jgi:hypothetical protein
VGTGDPMGDHTHVGMGMGVNPYPLVYMGDPMGLFFCCRYGYEVVIPDMGIYPLPSLDKK